MYLIQAHTRAGIIWHVHDDKKLHELSVHSFKRLISVILSPFLCFLTKRKIESTWSIPRTEPCTFVCCWAVELCTYAWDDLQESGHVFYQRSRLIQNTLHPVPEKRLNPFVTQQKRWNTLFGACSALYLYEVHTQRIPNIIR